MEFQLPSNKKNPVKTHSQNFLSCKRTLFILKMRSVFLIKRTSIIFIPLVFIKLNPAHFSCRAASFTNCSDSSTPHDVFHHSVFTSLYTVLFKTYLLIIRLILHPQISVHPSTGDIIPLILSMRVS